MIFTGVLMILLFFGLSLFLVVARQTIPTVDENRSEQRLKILSDLNAENEKILHQYRWIDKSKGVVGNSDPSGNGSGLDRFAVK